MQTDNARGILWALFAAALFACAAALAKIAVNEYHVLQILFFRQAVVFLSALPKIAQSFPQSLQTKYPMMHVARLLGAFVALSCSIWAIAVLPLTTAVTLGFAQAFFIVLLSLYFLRERIGRHRIIAVVLGFIGVIIVMRPGLDGIADLNVLIPVVGALGAAVAVISVRKLSQTEPTATLLIYQASFVGLLAGIPLFWLWVMPDLNGFLLLLAIGLLATVGQWVGVQSLRLGEASVIGNIKYTELIFALILGYLLFSEIPDSYTLAGALLIIAASVYIFRRERLSR